MIGTNDTKSARSAKYLKALIVSNVKSRHPINACNGHANPRPATRRWNTNTAAVTRIAVSMIGGTTARGAYVGPGFSTTTATTRTMRTARIDVNTLSGPTQTSRD